MKRSAQSKSYQYTFYCSYHCTFSFYHDINWLSLYTKIRYGTRVEISQKIEWANLNDLITISSALFLCIHRQEF